MKRSYFLFILVFLCSATLAQDLRQTIRGTVKDNITQEALVGANIIILDSKPLIGTVSDTDGKFRLENVPVGRIALKVSFMGYNDQVLASLNLTSGKELVVEVLLEERVYTGKEVEIIATQDKTSSINTMTTVSARSFTVEESQRYAGSRNDVARMASNFAGVRIADDSRNDIVIRGNSPMGLLWRLENVDIPNPNHYGAMGTTGGPVSILNNNLLANSDFMTAAFPAGYGNAIAGVFDLKMRNGNNENHEFLGQIGFNGFELGAEGPISEKSGASYMANYRYSTLEFFSVLGLEFGTGTAIPKYQDFSFKVNLPATKLGSFSIFGIGGISEIAILDSQSDTTNDKIDFYGGEGFDLRNGSDMAALGLNHTIPLNNSAYLHTTIAGTYHKFWTNIDSISPETNEILPWLRNNNIENKFLFHTFLKKKISSRHNFKIGFHADYLNYDLLDSIYNKTNNRFDKITDFNGDYYLVQPYLAWQYRINNVLTANLGLHYQYLSMNETKSFEPRLGLKWQVSALHALSFGVGMHSQLNPVRIYFNQSRLPAGEYQRPNENLDMTKSLHMALAHDWNINEYTRLKSEVYYQQISDAAVEKGAASSYSILNQGANFWIPAPDSLTNDGTGTNYGIELTLERFLNKGLYFLLTTSIYDSKYKGSDGIERNTAFNGNYVLNGLVGNEFVLGKSKNWKKKNTLIIDLKMTVSGGQRYTPINIEESLESGTTVYYDDLAFSEQFKDYFRTDIRIAWRSEGKKTTQEFAIDVQNMFNTQNIYQQRFNTRTGEITYTNQLGILIIPQFRIEF